VQAECGLPNQVLIEYFKLVQQGDQNIEARKEILIGQRAQLIALKEEMQKTLNALDYKIEVYENGIMKPGIEMALFEGE
jgi:hypothetical protein